MSQILQKLHESGPPSYKTCLAVTSTTVGIGYVIHCWLIKHKIQQKINKRQKYCKEAFKSLQEHLEKQQLDTDKVNQILILTFPELQKALNDRTLTAVDVLHAYQSKALKVHKRLNCITEPIQDAEDVARSLDDKTTEKGMLHGIPVSLKESFMLVDYDVTAGLGQRIGELSTEEAVLVKVLKKQGAIPFVRTNIPQTLMTYECSNPVYGRSSNPYDVTRVPGGSTGGEGAILGGKGSILGFGSDIGGSIRVPAHFCGCYGLKPTLERLSRKGHYSLSAGQKTVSGTVGPMSSDLDGLVTAMRAVLCDYQFKLDPEVAPIPFRNELYESSSPLRIGFYINDGYIQAVPACQRAVLMAKKALEKMGHTVVEFTPPRTKYVFPELYIRSVSGDNAENFTKYTNKDIIDPTMKDILGFNTLPRWCQFLVAYLKQIQTRDPVFGAALRAKAGMKSINEWFVHTDNVQKYRYEFYEAWEEKKLDAVICPPFATAAVPHGKVVGLIQSGLYSMLYNVVNYPAGCLPVTKVTGTDVEEMKSYPSKTYAEKCVISTTAGSQGLPIGVQCVALPFQEEVVLRVMRDVETGLQAE